MSRGKKILIGFGAVVIIGSIMGSTDTKTRSTTRSTGAQTTASKSATPSAPTVAFALSATELVAAYEANEIAADNKFKGKIVRVTGAVENIGKDLLDDPYVALKSGQMLLDVRCEFANEGALASLSKGQTITVVGTVDGKMMGVMMKKCRLE